jgi:hypothetical protein
MTDWLTATSAVATTLLAFVALQLGKHHLRLARDVRALTERQADIAERQEEINSTLLDLERQSWTPYLIPGEIQLRKVPDQSELSFELEVELLNIGGGAVTSPVIEYFSAIFYGPDLPASHIWVVEEGQGGMLFPSFSNRATKTFPGVTLPGARLDSITDIQPARLCVTYTIPNGPRMRATFDPVNKATTVEGILN